MGRRAVLGGLATAGVSARAGGIATGAHPVRAIAFDAFPIFDIRSIAASVEAHLPGRGRALADAWLAKLFGYSWLETAAGRYDNFPALATRALAFTAEAAGISLNEATIAELVSGFAKLDIWPDVKPALETLRGAGVRLAFLSNLGEAALRANMSRNGIESAFEAVLSTDRVYRYKPAPDAYRMALGTFGLPPEEIGFAAFGGWDAAGATWFGYRTAWINRLGVTTEQLDPAPAIVSRGMEGVLRLAGLG